MHDLFDIENLDKLGQELDEYANLADEIIDLLIEYDRQVCANFYELHRRVNFRNTLK